MNRISTFALALIALLAFHGARAATSIPIAEAGFALASNSGGDAIATPMSGDMGGGSSRTVRSTEVAVETPDRDAPKPETPAPARDEHAQKATPTDTNNSSTTTRKSRGNAHWQALLPGLMR